MRPGRRNRLPHQNPICLPRTGKCRNSRSRLNAGFRHLLWRRARKWFLEVQYEIFSFREGLLQMLSISKIAASFGLSLLTVSALAGAEDRIVSPVDSTRLVALRGHVHPKAQTQFDQGLAEPSLAIRYATLFLKPAAGLESFLAEQQSASSANYRRWL